MSLDQLRATQRTPVLLCRTTRPRASDPANNTTSKLPTRLNFLHSQTRLAHHPSNSHDFALTDNLQVGISFSCLQSRPRSPQPIRPTQVTSINIWRPPLCLLKACPNLYWQRLKPCARAHDSSASPRANLHVHNRLRLGPLAPSQAPSDW